MLYLYKKSISIKNAVHPIKKYPSFVLSRNTIMLQHLTGPISAYGRFKTKENFKISALKVVAVLMKGDCLQEVPNIVISLTNFWYFGKLDAEERWSLKRGGLNRRCDCRRNKKRKKQPFSKKVAIPRLNRC